jgi:hypothetical protein
MMSLIKKRHFYHTNSCGIVRKIIKILPSKIAGFLEGKSPLCNKGNKYVCRFLPTVKHPDGFTKKIALFRGGGGCRNYFP